MILQNFAPASVSPISGLANKASSFLNDHFSDYLGKLCLDAIQNQASPLIHPPKSQNHISKVGWDIPLCVECSSSFLFPQIFFSWLTISWIILVPLLLGFPSHSPCRLDTADCVSLINKLCRMCQQCQMSPSTLVASLSGSEKTSADYVADVRNRPHFMWQMQASDHLSVAAQELEGAARGREGPSFPGHCFLPVLPSPLFEGKKPTFRPSPRNTLCA